MAAASDVLTASLSCIMRAASRKYPPAVHSFAGTFFGAEKLSFLFFETGAHLSNADGVKLFIFP